ncbi:IclR family transcriptional regulator [Ferrimicrobium sp.]|uniref:IclR family transcriptional regulator n=1 Tax=Ferrimicrobium sp. TaxID=2926050 RepID=UPI00263757F3|nr:IclR family transcriptional regulator [Ferrimicrobium sp.]
MGTLPFSLTSLNENAILLLVHNPDAVTAIRTDERASEIAVIAKMAQLLDVLAGEPALTPSELGVRLGIPRTTVHRILQTLVAQDMLTPTHEPGPRLIHWSYKALGGLRTKSGPILDRLVKEFGETASVFVPSGAVRICIARHDGTQAVRHNINVGASVPIHVGSAGRILLAWLESDEREALIHNSYQLSGVAIAQPPPDWAEIRRQGWSTTAGERDPLLASISVPVFGPDQKVVAALSLSGPRMRLSNERVTAAVEVLKHEAALLSTQFEVGQ